MCRVVLSVTVVLTFWAISSAADPPTAPKDEFEKVLGELRESARRVNGAELTITAESKNDATNIGDVIHIKWSLDYTGPRPPLVIQKPMYPEHSFYATRIRVIAPGKSRLVPTVHLDCKEPLGEYYRPPPAEIFVTIDKGNTASGQITVASGTVKQELLAQWPKEMGDTAPRVLYIQLLHFPIERGEHNGLDREDFDLQRFVQRPGESHRVEVVTSDDGSQSAERSKQRSDAVGPLSDIPKGTFHVPTCTQSNYVPVVLYD